MKKYIPLILILVVAAILRLGLLDKFPTGLNADEAALGYNAYSLIETGKDEHGVSWPLVFRSFDDYKPPLYVYLAIPFIKTLGLTVLATRLPSALLGVLSVLLVYLLSRELFISSPFPPKNPNKKATPKMSTQRSAINSKLSTFNIQHQALIIPTLSALVLAISPWHIHFSRGALEVNVSTFLILLGVYAFYKSLKQSKYIYLFVVTLALSLYTYHSARIIAPPIALALFIIYSRDLFSNTKIRTTIIAVILGITISLPVVFQMFSKEGQSRFSGVSIFADSGPLSWVHEMRRTNPNPESIPTKIKYNKYSAYTGKFLLNYASHFSPDFLYIKGDKIDRSRVPGFGQMLSVTAPFALIGLVALFWNRSKPRVFILSWLLLSPIAASLTYQSPHALRSQNMVIPLSIITALGVSYFISLLSSKKILLYSSVLTIFAVTILQFSQYFYSYTHLYQRELPIAWQHGFEEITNYLESDAKTASKIVISTRYDQPYILMAFFSKYPPKKLQDELVMSPPDSFGFSTALSFSNFEFRKIDYEQDSKLVNSVLVAADEEVDLHAVDHTINSPAGFPIFKVVNNQTK